MAEVPLPSIEPPGPTASVEPIAPEPARWSTSAQGRLRVALISGSLAAVIGALLFFRDADLQSIADMLLMYAGLALMPIGASVAIVAARTLPLAHDQAYQPQSSRVPRNIFAIFWLVGVIAPLALHVESIRDLRAFSLVALAVAAIFVLSGGRWAFRWFANKLVAEWPTGRIDAPPAVPVIWPRNWTIGWAGLLGVLAGVLAATVEIALVWVTATLLGPSLAKLLPASMATEDILGEMLSQPLVLLGLLVAVAVVAPAIEEAAKALGLRLLRRQVQRPIDGLTLGMLIGLGFGVMESGLYLSSLNGWLIGGWLRLSTLMLHGIATSLIGVAYARSLQSGKRGEVAAGYGRAVWLHGLWNASAIGIGVGFGSLTLWWLGVICLGILIFLIVRMIPRTVLAGVQTVIQDGYQQAAANLPPEWSPSDYNIGWRLMGSRPQQGYRPTFESRAEVMDAGQPILSGESTPPIESPRES